MSQRILIVTGSPRKNGNSDLLAKAFAEGAEEAGNEVKVFSVRKHPVEPCVACDGCWSKKRACVVDDGFKKLSPWLEEADILVLATPLYWFSFSAQMKAAIDKLYAYMREDAPIKLRIQKAYLLVTAETEEEEDFSGILKSYQHICQYIQWQNGGVLLARGVGPKGAIKEGTMLESAKKLGREIV